MAKEKQDKRFLQVFNRNEKAVTWWSSLSRQLYLQQSPLQAFSMNFGGNNSLNVRKYVPQALSNV